MKQYHLISAYTAGGLDDEVNRFLSNGWELHGDPFVSTGVCFYQAVVKEVKK